MSSVTPGAAAPPVRLPDRLGKALQQVAVLAQRLVQSAGPPLVFGLRLWGAVCLACYVAFWLEFDSPSWAATSAAIVCQPVLGASLRKASFRLIGTVIGAIAIVILTVCFPQDRVWFLLGLALWCALCGAISAILQNFASYAAALAGYTAAIVAMDELGTVGGPGGDVLMLAINRASEIGVGIVCGGVVLAGTDFGRARRQLAAELARLTAALTGGLTGAFLLGRQGLSETQPVRRRLILRVTALGAIIDQAIGESSELRYRSRGLQALGDGMFTVLASWRIIAEHLQHLPDDQSQHEADTVLAAIPASLRATSLRPGPTDDGGTGDGAAGDRATGDGGTANWAIDWAADPATLSQACRVGARALIALPSMRPSMSPSLQLLAEHAAKGLLGLTRALDGLAIVHHPGRAVAHQRLARIRVPDWLPSLVIAVRVFVTIAVAALFWIVTAWPQGAAAMTFAALTVLLMSTKDDAYGAAQNFLLGAILAAVLAAIVGFAVLPQQVTFLGFALAIGGALVPIGALSTQPWNGQVFVVTAMLFTAFLGPQNVMTYDAQQFFNSSGAILVGVGIAAVALRLIPPLSPELRTRRLLARTLRDLRRLATGRFSPTPDDWASRVFGRLSALPQQTELVRGAQLIAALSVGTEIIRLRRVAGRFDVWRELDDALAALALGYSAATIGRLTEIDHTLTSARDAQDASRLRARAAICTISEALARHADYFDSGARR